MVPAVRSLYAHQQPGCEIRDHLTRQFKALLEGYYMRITQFAAVYGFIGAEQRCHAEYTECVEAREALKNHVRKHGCDSDGPRPYLVP